jgi:hypothetical protein
MSIRTSRSSGVTGRIVTVDAPGSLLVVNLGPLQPTAEVDVDRLPLRIRVERRVARLAVAVAGLLPAAEREVDLGAGRAGVDVDDPVSKSRIARKAVFASRVKIEELRPYRVWLIAVTAPW